MPDTIATALHVIKITDTSIQTATQESTDWFLWVPRNEAVTWVDLPTTGTLARVLVQSWLMDRHGKIVLGCWSTSE